MRYFQYFNEGGTVSRYLASQGPLIRPLVWDFVFSMGGRVGDFLHSVVLERGEGKVSDSEPFGEATNGWNGM